MTSNAYSHLFTTAICDLVNNNIGAGPDIFTHFIAVSTFSLLRANTD